MFHHRRFITRTAAIQTIGPFSIRTRREPVHRLLSLKAIYQVPPIDNQCAHGKVGEYAEDDSRTVPTVAQEACRWPILSSDVPLGRRLEEGHGVGAARLTYTLDRRPGRL